MNLTELKKKPIGELIKIAEFMGLEGMARNRKQDIIFAILKRHAMNGEEIFGDGVLEILSDGFGFLRSAAGSYLAGPDDIYVSPSQILSSLPESTKQKIKERMPFYQEWQAKKQQEAEQQKMQKLVQEGIQRKQMRDAILEGEGQGQKAENVKEADKLKIALEEDQNMQMPLAQNNMSPEEKDALYAKVQEPGEVQKAQAASILGGLGIR